jgi:arylsulfatase A-like enzyme
LAQQFCAAELLWWGLVFYNGGGALFLPETGLNMAKCALGVFVAWLTAASACLAVEGKPNILIFLCDDTGWAEFGFQGGTDIPTPNIDSIAASGVRFPQGYVSGPYCSPTRAGLMTGRYQTRFGHEFNSTARETGLALTETTIANRFKDLGYATAAIGKWHLGVKPNYRPVQRGFDEFLGTLGNTPFFHPTQFVDSRQSNEPRRRLRDDDFYTTDQYADRAVDWLGKQGDKPWLLYVPFNAQHAPLQAPKKYLDRFNEIDDPTRLHFAACMSAMDDAVGKVMTKVRDLGQEENTLVFFLSDNGGPTAQTSSSNKPLRGGKSSTWEGGVRVPFCMQWKGKLKPGTTYDHPVIQLDILPTALAAAGTTAAGEWKLDGVDLMPYLTGEKTEGPHETLYWRFGPQWAVRHGDWKLVAGNGGNNAGQLHNLVEDISETKDVAAEHADKVTELKGLWDAWNAEQAPPSAPKEKPNRAQRQKRRQQERQRHEREMRERKAEAATG